jgi:hypothetical protein
MNRRSVSALLTVTAASLVIGGCGQSWIIHAQAVPDPFLNQRRYAVLPVDFTGLTVGEKSEAEYQAGKSPDQQASFEGDKAGMNETFFKVLVSKAHDAGIEVVPATGPASAPFQIHPLVPAVEPGYYAAVAAAPGRVRMIVRLTDAQGTTLDQIEMEQKGGDFSTGGRLRVAAGKLGGSLAEYLAARAAGTKTD